MKKRTLIAALALAAAGTSGCAVVFGPEAAVGTPATDVRAKYGAPTDERTLTGGVRAWDYVQGPQGFRTYRVTFDSGDRVQRVEQILTQQNFLNIKAGETSREDVARMFGRPGETTFYPLSDDEVWTYRYRDVTLEMLNDVHFSRSTGKVRYYALYRDPAYTNSFDQ